MAFSAIGDIDYQTLYDQSFGGLLDEKTGMVTKLPDRTRYWDPMKGINKIPDLVTRKMAWTQKSVNTAATSGTAGYAMIPLAYDPRVVDITRLYTPLLGIIPKVTNLGLTANYYRTTSRSKVGMWGNEQGAIKEQDDTRELVNATMKFCRISGKVTGVARVASAHFIDAMTEEILNKTQSMNEELEDTIVNGNASTNPLEHDGLITSCSANNTNMNNDPITLTDVKTLIADCYMDKGHPNLIITDPYTAQSLESQMMDFIRYTNPYKTIAWGLETLTINSIVGPIPVLPSQFMPTTAGQRRLLCVDTNNLERRVLLDLAFEQLGKTEDAEKFYLKTYTTMVNKFPEGMGQLYGIGAVA